LVRQEDRSRSAYSEIIEPDVPGRGSIESNDSLTSTPSKSCIDSTFVGLNSRVNVAGVGRNFLDDHPRAGNDWIKLKCAIDDTATVGYSSTRYLKGRGFLSQISGWFILQSRCRYRHSERAWDLGS
jgi:hypothetical protein